MKTGIRLLTILLAALALPGIAEAHTGVHIGGLSDGFVHPFSGLDHLLTMIAVGLWAASLGGTARWVVPSSFITVMTLGAALGASGITLPAVEPVIAISVVVLGLLCAASVRVPVVAASAIVAVFALFHGHAHGSEMPAMASPLGYGLGFVAATTILHGAGLLVGMTVAQRGAAILGRAAGSAIAAIGVALVLAL